ncbi:ABC transporter permease [Enterocloster bolteae]|jgi:ABC-2 type transport system permease protein|uniref:ABC transporter permease n=2 Tax=Clostridia TaxID=186801 RepID=UPI001D0823A8|nr:MULTISPECIES: ABC transporter permease [Clostridia]MCB7089934.1 ABC transporter permease [Enterocloster bolteae]MCH1934836.1 ABC transporter permease [Enterocloster sp. OA11]
MREWMKQAGSLASSVKKRYITIPMLILLLAPTILSLLMGAEFIHLPFQKVPTVIVNHDHSETVQSLIQMISDNRTFDVIACTGEEDDLKEAFYYNKALAGIVIPEHFSEDLLNSREAKIMIFNDGALSTVASGMRGTIAEALGTIKSGYMLKLAEGRGIPPQAAMNLIAPMGYVTKAISNPSKNVAYMMMEGILLTIVQIGAGCVGACVCERKSFGRLMKKAGFITGIACISALGCMVTQSLCFGFPYKSSPWAGILMTVFTCFGITLFGILQNLGTGGNCEEAVQKCGIISFTMLLAGYTFPVISMPWPCKFLTWFMPNTHYILPLRDMALVERSFLSEAHHVLWLMGFSAVMVLLAARKFRNVRTEAGNPLTDSHMTESGVAGI